MLMTGSLYYIDRFIVLHQRFDHRHSQQLFVMDPDTSFETLELIQSFVQIFFLIKDKPIFYILNLLGVITWNQMTYEKCVKN